MDASERLGIICAKAVQKPRVNEPVPVRRKGGLIVRSNGRPTAYGVGPATRGPDRVVTWVTEPEERGGDWRPAHRHEPHALTRIARKLKRDWQ